MICFLNNFVSSYIEFTFDLWGKNSFWEVKESCSIARLISTAWLVMASAVFTHCLANFLDCGMEFLVSLVRYVDGISHAFYLKCFGNESNYDGPEAHSYQHINDNAHTIKP